MQIGMSLYKCHLSLWQVWAVVLLMLSLQVLNGRGALCRQIMENSRDVKGAAQILGVFGA